MSIQPSRQLTRQPGISDFSASIHSLRTKDTMKPPETPERTEKEYLEKIVEYLMEKRKHAIEITKEEKANE